MCVYVSMSMGVCNYVPRGDISSVDHRKQVLGKSLLLTNHFTRTNTDSDVNGTTNRPTKRKSINRDRPKFVSFAFQISRHLLF